MEQMSGTDNVYELMKKLLSVYIHIIQLIIKQNYKNYDYIIIIKINNAYHEISIEDTTRRFLINFGDILFEYPTPRHGVWDSDPHDYCIAGHDDPTCEGPVCVCSCLSCVSTNRQICS